MVRLCRLSISESMLNYPDYEFFFFFLDFEENCEDLDIYMESGRCVLKLEAPK